MRDRSKTTQANPLLMVIGVTGLALLGCAVLAPEPTATAFPTKTPAPTATPLPTDTPEPTHTPTDIPTATPNFAATEQVQAMQTEMAIIEEIDMVLQDIGFSTDVGYLAWGMDESLPIQVVDYGTIQYVPVSFEHFSDFVMQVDVTWDSTSGLAGCGIIFRAEEDLDRGEQYLFFTLRLSGLPHWDVELWDNNSWKSTLTGRMRTSAALKYESGSTNRYALVANGNQLTAYANGTRLGAATILSRQEGIMAFFGWQESGQTTCSFDNGWLWSLEEGPNVGSEDS
jgi:hypothetical protein